MAVKPRAKLDVDTLEDVALLVSDIAEHQDLGGNLDSVESSLVTGTYDWRGYLQEETDIARRREGARAKDAEKKPARPEPGPAPSVFYG